ncbi:O-antigen ligase family protein [Patescibacteria group bacterium]|nr:O-antigen ligase family protein [Patescibacteria group bacterium]
MTLSDVRNIALEAAWRLSLIVLPWQIRFFTEALIDGKPWEQGRLSLYASMLLMVAVIALEGSVLRDRRFWRVAGMLLALTIPSLFLVTSWQWALWSALLIAWGIAMRRVAPWREREAWVLGSLALSACVGLLQVAMQYIPPITLLGMAEQIPATSGVSVIETGVERWLRAYGPFPHPNIFGGWMAVGLILAVRRWMDGSRAWWLSAFTVLFTLALYGSFSRSAWLAVLVGLGWLFVTMWRRLVDWRSARPYLLIGCVVVGAVWLRPELLFTRLAPSTRLETWSVNERIASLEQGIEVVRAHPLGTGPFAYRLGLERVCVDRSCVTKEPPHNVFLLMLAELGWVRLSFVLLGCVFLLLRGGISRHTLPLVFALTVIALLDHYLWSAWSGMGLIALVWVLDSERASRHSNAMD